jgi:uncharacterized protein (DUF433 family)
MTAPNRIVIDPAICHGKPVIQGTRVPVTVVVGSLAGGMTFEDVQREYDVTADDIRAALRFVGELAERALPTHCCRMRASALRHQFVRDQPNVYV